MTRRKDGRPRSLPIRVDHPLFRYPVQYDPSAESHIPVRFAGLIWLKDPDGGDVDLDKHRDIIPPGVFAPCDGDHGIQTEDELMIFESDFDAAQAVATALTEKTGLEYTIWYESDNPEGKR